MTSNHALPTLVILALGLVVVHPVMVSANLCGTTMAPVASAPVAERIALAPPLTLPKPAAPTIISVPQETFLPETCQLITPLGPARGVDRSWGAVRSGLSREFPQQDGAFLGFSWGVGSLVPYVGTTGYRCCNSDGCRICDATSCRRE